MDGISKAVELLGKEDEQHQLLHPTITLANVIDTQHQQYLENYFSFENENEATNLGVKYLNLMHLHPPDFLSSRL